MFAIALFDNSKKKIHLIRDFAGIKPLHYGFNKRSIIFASQYNQVVRHPEFSNNSYNSGVLKLYLSQQFIPPSIGLVKNTYQVSPGEIITFDLSGVKSSKRYWVFPKKNSPTIFSEKKAMNKIESSLNYSVKNQMHSDVPLGVLLSSGIDSTLISILAKKNTEEELNAFTIGSNSKTHDESNDARKYAETLNLKHYIEKLDSGIVSGIMSEIDDSITEPFADISLIPTQYISKIAKRNVTVALSGDGADELFFGYERFDSIVKNFRIQSLPYLLKYFIYGIDKVFWNNSHINSNSLFDSCGDAHFHLQRRFKSNLLDDIFPDLIDNKIPDAFNIYDYNNPSNKRELLHSMRYAEFYGMMQKTLRKVDIASMHNSLELRVPFLSKFFLETSLKIDPLLNFKNNSENKTILRKVISMNYKNLHLQQKKKGFSVPMTKWLRKGLKKKFTEVLMDQNLIDHFGLNKFKLENLLNDHMEKRKDNKWPMFTIYSLFIWRNNLSK
jgi:asparagine synthase (glutamine-hydrolysing)